MDYGLIAIDGEIILKTNAETTDEAVDYFSKIKKLSKRDLLNIFDVVKIETN